MDLPSHLVGDRWQVVRAIARGGMGAVFEARHHLTGASVALKVLFTNVAFDVLAAERFKREVSFATAIGHPGIVRVLDAGADRTTGALYIAMELLVGETLDERMRRARDPAGVLRLIAAVLDPLAAAHERGIVHRDLKPGNVFVTRAPDGSERAHLLDLGLAREIESATATASHSGLGTPRYMAPEQATSAGTVTAAADVWSAGIMIYETIAGVPPFDGATPTAAIFAACSQPHVPLSRAAPGTSLSMSALVDRCLAKDPRARPRDARQLLAELAPLLDLGSSGTMAATPPPPLWEPPPKRRSRLPWLALGGVLMLGGAAASGAYFLLDEEPPAARAPEPIAEPVVAAPSPETPPPRLVYPLSGSLVTTQRPTLRVELAEGATGARVEICADIECTRAIATIDGGGSATPEAALARGRVFWRARSLVNGEPSSAPTRSWTLFVPARGGARTGVALVFPDLDGDGRSDVIAGMPGIGGGQLAVFGAEGGTVAPRGLLAQPEPVVGMGEAITAGDMNADGRTDVVWGAPRSRDGQGLAYVLFSGLPRVQPFYGGPGLGAGVAALGDLDADGYSELAIVARSSVAIPIVHLARGGPDMLTMMSTQIAPFAHATNAFASSIGAAGDVDADGCADLVIGDPDGEGGWGCVHFLFGRGPLAQVGDLSHRRMCSPDANARFGTRVGPAGDTDGDGFADFFVAGPNASTVYVLRGSERGPLDQEVQYHIGPAGGVEFGASIAGAGDIDGDGFSDVVIGAPAAESATGRVYVVSFVPGRDNLIRGEIVGPDGPGGRFGHAVAGAGDVDGDGFFDIAVGAPGAGAAYVYFGGPQGITGERRQPLMPPPGDHSTFGETVL